MADLELHHWGNGEIRITAQSEMGAHWLTLDHASSENAQGFSVGDSAYYPGMTQDMIVHEIQDAGLVISS